MRKKEIKQENIYDNRYSLVLPFRAGENILELNDRQKCVEQNIKT